MKKIIVLLLTVALLISNLPVVSFAGDKKTVEATAANIAAGEPAKSSTDPTDEALQSAILAAKDKITIPAQYSEFNYNYYDTDAYHTPYWMLSWADPNKYGSISVNIDVNGHISNYSNYNYNKTNGGVAKYLKSELKSAAEAFVAKIAPDTTGHLKLVSSDYTNIFGGDYVFTYERIENDIAFPDNSVTVNVNSITGEITNISITWLYGASIPAVKDIIDKNEATSKLRSNMKMKLIYRSNYIYRYDIMPTSTETEAYLVYEPSENYISIDAKTGKVYTTKNQYIMNGEAEKSATGWSASNDQVKKDSGSSMSLTEDEIKKIEELKDLISRSKAINLITGNKSLYMDNNLTEKNANLSKIENNGKTTYVWNVNLSDPRKITPTDYYRGNAYATIDAQTGKILSYYASLKNELDSSKQSGGSQKIKYNKKQSRIILEKFLKTQAGSRFTNSILVSENNDYVAYYQKEVPVYGGYSFVYNRTNNDIEYPDNALYGSVDGVTGKIYSYGFNWNENVKFQSSSGVISSDKAMDYFVANDGYGLKYEVNQTTKYNERTGLTSFKNEVRLVYRPDVNPSYLSPFTGEQINYDGTVYTKTSSFSYKDVPNTSLYRNVLLLADMNIGFAGDSFLQNQNVTVGELKSLLSSVGYSSNKIDMADTALITRQEMAKILISWLGLDKVSKLNIYKVDFKDEAVIDSKYYGSVALAVGFGIMGVDADKFFKPTNNVNRLDAVNIICSFIEVQKNGVYY